MLKQIFHLNKLFPLKSPVVFKLQQSNCILKKWLVTCIYKPPLQIYAYYFRNVTDYLSKYSKNYIFFFLGNFNLEPAERAINYFVEQHELQNLIKQKTCFKSKKGTCIDFILTNQNFCFNTQGLFQTGLSDHHDMIYFILKL